jgi:hypothetical protein
MTLPVATVTATAMICGTVLAVVVTAIVWTAKNRT